MDLAQRAAKDGEILGEDVDQTALDGAPTGDHAVAQELFLFDAKAHGAMGDEHIQFAERARVQKQLQALAGGQLALGMLSINAPLSTTQLGLLPQLAQVFDFWVNWHGVSSL